MRNMVVPLDASSALVVLGGEGGERFPGDFPDRSIEIEFDAVGAGVFSGATEGVEVVACGASVSLPAASAVVGVCGASVLPVVVFEGTADVVEAVGGGVVDGATGSLVVVAFPWPDTSNAPNASKAIKGDFIVVVECRSLLEWRAG
ncbi:hypothetical protein H310_10768 [Aphanomyces invadans]|uniref:Uncharacterized protein n=1 Tax=Aphanomyces invadans TaxID=157072 RepID=A0A024TPQ7_9STRA|nr:hypothetical protein H310_10768 [Aphanomyces invadans]ETV96135.1 hypothetical protein H310_10768 [Aphanomyces invadans]|eukprot:XP_008875446.1 hypothetical protein H310_10768 [Aphanomyces invadans]